MPASPNLEALCGVSDTELERLSKALNSAQFLQSDLQRLLGTTNPLLAEIVSRELEVVDELVVRLVRVESVARSLRTIS